MSLVIIRAFIIYVFVIIAIRIMGKRQVGELKPHELVITFLISSTATIPLQDNNMPLLNCIIPVHFFVFPIEITELIHGGVVWKQQSSTVTVFFFQHYGISGLQAILFLSIEILIQCPTDILFILCQRAFITAFLRSKNSYILV